MGTTMQLQIDPALRAKLDAIPCYLCRGMAAVRALRSASVGVVVGELGPLDLPKFCDDHAERYLERVAQLCARKEKAA